MGGVICVAALGIGILLLAKPSFTPVPQQQGVTFSILQSQALGLQWRDVYDALLTDLEVKHLRLMAYWNLLEEKPNQYDFTDLDIQMNEAEAAGTTVVLVVGRKLPRWPECHVPTWASELSEVEQQQRVLRLIEEVVKRYKDHPALVMWQVENEPLLDFGVCPPFDKAFFEQEIALVRRLDTHPLLITDSGELHLWLDASAYGDVFGTTMYRTVLSRRTNAIFSYDYLYPAWLYRAKGRLVHLLRGKETVIAELQGEPWGRTTLSQLSREERSESFSLHRFKTNHLFSVRTEFPVAYWWGVEYWYWEKIHEEFPAFWEYAATLFKD